MRLRPTQIQIVVFWVPETFSSFFFLLAVVVVVVKKFCLFKD